MRRSRGNRRLGALVGLAGAFALGAAAIAHGQFSSDASAGSLQVSTAALASPATPSGRVWLCLPNVAVTVAISWSDDSSDDVEVLRATSPNGPFAPITDQQPFAGTYFDTTRFFSGTLYYEVQTTEGSWQSPPSALARVTLPDSRCR